MDTKKKRNGWKTAAIVLGAILLLIVIALVAGFFILRGMFGGGAPEVNISTDGDPIVSVTGGQISGGMDGGIYTFLGVPYAEAKERFKPAEAVTPWQGVRECVDYGAISPQTSFFGGGGDGQDNNCQNLNIWTPALDGGRRPVMVWFHGGGMTSGSANESQTQGRNLSESEDVVVVTVNHRLGILGYLDLSAYGDEYAESGNVGVLDMVESLRWVHDNITAFGGDPDNVTVFGQSGGGAKALALMTTPLAKGLFHKAINESRATVVLGPIFATREEMARVTELTLAELGVSDVSELQTMDFSRLNSAGSNALNRVAAEFNKPGALGTGHTFEWMPVVDGKIIPTHPLTDEGFAEAALDVPLLIGTNLNEWSFGFGIDAGMSEADVAKRLVDTYGDRAEAILTAFKSAYADLPPVNALYTDIYLRPPIAEITEHKAMQAGAPVYSYLMTFGNPNSTHGTEIPLVFANSDSAFSKTMAHLWASFARDGVPSADGVPEWEPFTVASGATMILDTQSHIGYYHDKALMELLGGH